MGKALIANGASSGEKETEADEMCEIALAAKAKEVSREEFFELLAQALIHYLSLLVMTKEPALVIKALAVGEKCFDATIAKSANQPRLCQSAFKFCLRAAQMIEDHMLVSSPETFAAWLSARERGIVFRLRSQGENYRDSYEVVICAVHSVCLGLDKVNVDTVDASGKLCEFLQTCREAVEGLTRKSTDPELLAEAGYQITKVYYKVRQDMKKALDRGLRARNRVCDDDPEETEHTRRDRAEGALCNEDPERDHRYAIPPLMCRESRSNPSC